MSRVKRLVVLSSCRWLVLLSSVMVIMGCSTARRTGLRPLQLSTGLLEQRLQQLVDKANADGGSQVGIYVQASASEQLLVNLGGNKRMIPASVSKLLTAVAGLTLLGPQDRFVTSILTDKQQEDGRAVGDLYVRGSGDPSFTIAHLQQLVDSLVYRGLKVIERDVVIDASVFDDVAYGAGWMWDDLNTTFAAPITGFNIQHNMATVRFASTRSKDNVVPFFADPLGQLLQLKSTVRWATAGATSSNGELRWSLEGAGASGPVALGARIRLEGSLVPAREGEYEAVAIPLQEPALFVGQLLKDMLLLRGVTIGGMVRLGKTPEAPLVLLASHASASLANQLVGWMKASDNFGMECLLKRLGAATSGSQGSFQQGLWALRRFLQQEVALPPGAMLVADGSGISRYSQVSPKQLVSLLQYGIQHFAIGPELLVSLPTAGVDGTLYGRMQRAPWLGRVRAKTGTMRGASSLAGFLATQSGHLLTFAIMAEGFVGSPAPFRQMQEQILAELLQL